MQLLFVLCLVCIALVAPFAPNDYPCVAPPYVIDVYNVTSTIRRRFACTRVYSEIVNTANSSQEMCFSVQLPKEAFMSGLCLEVGGRKYAGVVREKEAARRTHEENVRTGVTSGLVESRGMDKFRVCLSAGPGARAAFSVEYQQLLIMRLGVVRHTISIQPTQPVPYLIARVTLLDSLLPESVYSSNGSIQVEPELAVCTYRPTLEEQRNVDCERGVSVDLETSYRPLPVPGGVGEGSLSGGYFVQFFSPSFGLECLCQRFIFVIDQSGSMRGQKMRQAKQAALYLLRSLKETDFFNVIAFHSSVTSFQPEPVSVGEWRERGEAFVTALSAGGSTNINAAALRAVGQLCGSDTRCVSQVTLLSDGQATAGETHLLAIANNVRTACTSSAVSLNCLSFGQHADHQLMRALAYGSGGRAQRIYEGRDAESQLVDFLRTVLCPLLSDIRFSFPDGGVRNLSVTSFPAYYRGDELLVSGELTAPGPGPGPLAFQVLAVSAGGEYRYSGEIETRVSSPEDRTCLEGQLHAYQLIRQGIEALSAAPASQLTDQLRARVLSHALRFRFVTDLTSLLVSPLEAPGCDCPSSCACAPQACGDQGTGTGDKGPDNIKLNPASETTDTETDGDTLSYYRAISPGSPGVVAPAFLRTQVLLTQSRRTTRPKTTTTPITIPTPPPPPTTTTPPPTTTPIATTTAIQPDCGEWKNLTLCTRGTSGYLQIRCGACLGSGGGRNPRRVPCGPGYRGPCFLRVRRGTASCVARRGVLSRKQLGRILANPRRCEKIGATGPPPASCVSINGACAIKLYKS